MKRAMPDLDCEHEDDLLMQQKPFTRKEPFVALKKLPSTIR